jgi:hypothetical protein
MYADIYVCTWTPGTSKFNTFLKVKGSKSLATKLKNKEIFKYVFLFKAVLLPNWFWIKNGPYSTGLFLFVTVLTVLCIKEMTVLCYLKKIMSTFL